MGEKQLKGIWKLLNIVLKSRSCVWDTGANDSGRRVFVVVDVDIVAGRHK